jgi:Protein of unknown function (DUF2510)
MRRKVARMSDTSSSAAIDVNLKFFPLAFVLYLCKPRLEVDGGQPVKASWGTMRVPVAPGRHQVRAYVPYLFFRNMGDATTTVDVAPGQAVQASWSAPWLAFLPGKWKLSVATVGAGAAPAAQVYAAGAVAAASGGAPVAMSSPAAAWHPDPTGRPQLRYWDGQTWTANVSNGGVTATDPLG